MPEALGLSHYTRQPVSFKGSSQFRLFAIERATRKKNMLGYFVGVVFTREKVDF